MSRYGIAEWYGRDLLAPAPVERHVLAANALGRRDVPSRPFRPITCNKRRGVCSLRPCSETASSIAAADGRPITVCPNRLEQDSMLVRWLANIIGFRPEGLQPARELPFMQSVETRRPAGKIDLINAADRHEFRWFGLEMQAFYFSSDGMNMESESLQEDGGARPPQPLGNRCADWRSSRAKRPISRLQVKGPALRQWHSKIAVAVDTPFSDSMGGPSETPERDLDAGDVVSLAPELPSGRLECGHWEALTLEDACE